MPTCVGAHPLLRHTSFSLLGGPIPRAWGRSFVVVAQQLVQSITADKFAEPPQSVRAYPGGITKIRVAAKATLILCEFITYYRTHNEEYMTCMYFYGLLKDIEIYRYHYTKEL